MPRDISDLKRMWPKAQFVDEPMLEFGQTHLYASSHILDKLVAPSGFRAKDRVRIWNANALMLRDNACYVGATDGSGHQDGYGGWACVVRRQVGWAPFDDGTEYEELPTDLVRFGSIFGGTVLRNEMQALIEAMRAVGVMHANDRKENSEIPVMLWVTDRADVAEGLMRDAEGNPLTRRATCADLWAQIVYLSRFCSVVPRHIPRNTEPDQALCDRLAGNSRNALKAETKLHETYITRNNIPWTKKNNQKERK